MRGGQVRGGKERSGERRGGKRDILGGTQEEAAKQTTERKDKDNIKTHDDKQQIRERKKERKIESKKKNRKSIEVEVIDSNF